jgi:hypothetical protein
MKRLLHILGRLGTVLIAVSLGLLVVSLIPPAQINNFTGSQVVAPRTFQKFGPGPANPFTNLIGNNATFYSAFFSTLTPQQELKLPLKCNGTVDVYVLKVSLVDFLATFQSNDVDALTAFLAEHPEVVGWQGQISEGTVDYTPTEIINATVIFANPSSDNVFIDYKGSILSLLAPGYKVQALAMYIFPLGVLLSLPFLNKFRNRPTKRLLRDN